MLTFDDTNSKHEYRWNGAVVPSVTQIIEEFIPFNFAGEAVERALQLGQAVHKTTELMDKATLGEYDPQLEPWIEGWRQFKRDIPGLVAKCRRLMVDIKTGAKNPKWFIQLGGYSLFETERGKEVIEERYYSTRGYAGTVDRIYWGPGRKDAYLIVQLQGDNFYKLIEVPYPIFHFQNQFLSLLNTHQIKKECGV